MGSRGRKSGAELALAPVVQLRPLPEPPQGLTPAQAEVWRMVIASRAGDMIKPEAFPVLVEYCRWVCNAAEVSEQLAGVKPAWWRSKDGLALIERLRKLQEQATRMVNSCAVKLRLPPSTRTHPEKAGRAAMRGEKLKPWEDAEEA